MLKEGLVGELKATFAFFQNSSDCLAEEDSNFAPGDGTFTVAHHVAHVAQTIDWFIDGAFSPEGFDMNFDELLKKNKECKSLDSARQMLKEAIESAINVIQSKSEEELQQPIVEGPIMGGAPRLTVIAAISDHTAHHRGALSVYSRLLGKEPKMPYGE